MEILNLPIEEYTTPNPITAQENTPVEELAGLIKTHGIRHIPITRGDQIVGIVTDRDLRVIRGLNSHEKLGLTAADVMIPDPVTVSSESTIEEVAFLMSDKRIGSVLVNEGENFLGIFTVTDALNALIEIVRSERRSQNAPMA